jgi:phosphoglucosamine mutase
MILFGTSGIRDLYGSKVNEQLALRIANVFADKDVVVARDTRTTGEALAFAAISGITGRGKNAIYIGIAPTPTLALATKKYKCKGIMITASHNPPEYNGLKFYDNGREIGRDAEKELEKKYNTGETAFSSWDKVGKRIDDNEVIQEHANYIANRIDGRAIAAKMPRVVVDCNGAGAVLTPIVLEQLGCDVITINRELVGFARASEPNAENLKGLAAKVREHKADLGIGHDGDADRAVVVDETGEVLPLDVQLAVMQESELEKAKGMKAKVVATVEASLCVREAAERAGAEVVITPVGSNFVADAVLAGAVFGGEPCGEYVFSKGLNVPDGVMTAAKFVELFCLKGKLSVLKKKYKTYSMLREKFTCQNEKKYALVENIKKAIKTGGQVRSDDGLRVDETDGWFLIRASGTEPYIRLTMEYKQSAKLEAKANELREIIKKVIG